MLGHSLLITYYCYSRAGSHLPTLCFKTVLAGFLAHGYSLLFEIDFLCLVAIATYPTLANNCVLGILRNT